MIVKLGVAGKKEKAKTLKLGDFVDTWTMPKVPFAEDIMPNDPALYDYNPLGNNDYGDCTIAACGHFMRRLGYNVTEKMVIDQYLKLSGGADEGLYGIDVMTAWRKNGLFGLPPISAFALVDMRNALQVGMSISLFRGLFWAGGMPTEVMDNIDADWAIREKQDKSAGGHMVWVHSYSYDWWVANTWGMRKSAEREFMCKNGWEAFVVLHPGIIDINGNSACGLALGALKDAIRAIT